MDAVHATLRRLRAWFVVWFVVQSAAGTAIAAYIVDELRRHALFRYAMGSVSPGFTLTAGIAVSTLLLVLALLVLAALLELQPWSRTVLLVVGWITVVSAITSLLALPGSAGVLEPAVGAAGGDWLTFEAVNALTKVLDLAFWSWVIYTLQINPGVRSAFVHAPRGAAGAGSGAQHA